MYSWVHLLWLYLYAEWNFLHWRMWHVRQIQQMPHMRGLPQHISTKESTPAIMKQTLLLIRHGQTAWNVEHRLPGQLPGVALNDTGRQQASRLAEALAVLPISAIISSPLERAFDTAEYIAKGRTLTIQQEADLMDTDIGPWAGQVIEELSKADPAWKAYVKDPTVAPEGVETFPQVQERVVAAVERWRKKEQIGAYPAFVAHADIVKLLVAHYSGLEIARAAAIHIDNASVSLIELEDEHKPRIVAIGWSPNPGWLKSPIDEIMKGEHGVASGDEKVQQV